MFPSDFFMKFLQHHFIGLFTLVEWFLQPSQPTFRQLMAERKQRFIWNAFFTTARRAAENQPPHEVHHFPLSEKLQHLAGVRCLRKLNFSNRGTMKNGNHDENASSVFYQPSRGEGVGMLHHEQCKCIETFFCFNFIFFSFARSILLCFALRLVWDAVMKLESDAFY